MATSTNISGWTGNDLLHHLIELTDKANEDWKKLSKERGDPDYLCEDRRLEKKFRFQLRTKKLFQLELIPKKNQPGNGKVTFWDQESKTWSITAPYDEQTWWWILKSSKFEELYQRILHHTFGEIIYDQLPLLDPTNKHFQLFVLFQFEIARRVDGDHQDLPSRKQTRVAIDIALRLGTRDACKALIRMFTEQPDHYTRSVRLQQYINLKCIAADAELEGFKQNCVH